MTLQKMLIFEENLMVQNGVTELVITRLISLRAVSHSDIGFGLKVHEYFKEGDCFTKGKLLII
jgi:hypothetical protein